MKKLYKKGKVHPSPPPSSATSGGDHLLLALQLPASILTLAATLSPQDKQVLAYLISCCGTTITTRHKTFSDGGCGGKRGGEDHPPAFECNCFRCYMSFWARWDASPSRQLIHEIIEAYEERLIVDEKNKSVTSKKKKKRSGKRACDDHDHHESKDELTGLEEVSQLQVGDHDHGDIDHHHQDGDDHQAVEQEKGSMSKMVSFLGEKIWYFLN